MSLNNKPKRNREQPPPGRGLPSIEQAREQRGKMRMLPPKFWAWAAVFIGASIIIWWKLEEGEIRKLKAELLGRQRAVKEELGPRWYPLRDRISAWTTACAAPSFKERRAADLSKSWDFRKKDGIYLRLAQAAAKDAKTIREAAQKSLHDGFTSCLLLVPNPSPLAGKRCETTQDCPREQLCNDYKHCSAYSQPFNLRLAFRSMYVMTDDYVRDIQAITKKLTVRGAIATFNAANKYDLPVAARLLTRAKYFMVVVDEPAKDADLKRLDHSLPEVKSDRLADDRSIPTAPHQARVCVWRLSDNKQMLAVREEAAGTLVGNKPSGNLRSRVAMQRQANSCALALAVRESMGAPAGAKAFGVEPDNSTSQGTPSASASAANPSSPSPSPSPSPSAGAPASATSASAQPSANAADQP